MRGAEADVGLLTVEQQGIAAAYGNTLLFVGYEVEGLIEVAVYPRYRFSSDDRVQGHLGYVRAQPGTPWATVLEGVDTIFEAGQANYRTAVTLRATEQRAHGSRYDSAYDGIADIFRECWHGFALRLEREGHFRKGSATFTGSRRGPVLVSWRDDTYTLMVFPTGSITLLVGDRRAIFAEAAN
ncbi:MAG TPA: hypothetical protein VM409_00835 [Chloroflexia bacterium]|nr:hypothetical protein [Chloroflexia bacterium]